MLLQAIGEMLGNFASLEFWLVMVVGIIIGLTFGIIPGLTGLVAISLILPFVFKMNALQSLPLMMAVLAVQFIGGLVTAILLNVPGTPMNAATLMDGYPMTQKGEAGRALGAAFTASGLGSIITALMALLMIPLILPLIMALRLGDMVFIILLGLAFVGVLASGSMLKGLISGFTGLLLSFVGHQVTTGADRFTFGTIYLYDGLALIALALGMFAVPEMIVLAARGGAIARNTVNVKGMTEVLRGARDAIQHWTLVIRSSIIGFIIGIAPGVGATSAAFVAYAQAKQTSRHPELFGTGIVEGVIAPEVANNAEEGGAILTTLALGIPGTGPHVIILGALMILGITPGPEMLTKHLGLSLTIIATILVSASVAAAACLVLAPYLSRVSAIPGRILAPLIIVIVFAGVYVTRGTATDMLVLLVFSVVGFIMKRYDYNRPALLLGFVLGLEFEKYFFISLDLVGPLFFLTPTSIGLILVIIGVLVYQPLTGALRRRKEAKKG